MPNLTFSTDAERMTHPLASLIPQTVWDAFFQDGLKDEELVLMAASNPEDFQLLNAEPYWSMDSVAKQRCLLVRLWSPLYLVEQSSWLTRYGSLFIQLSFPPLFQKALSGLLLYAVESNQLVIVERLIEILPQDNLVYLIDHEIHILIAAIQKENPAIFLRLLNTAQHYFMSLSEADQTHFLAKGLTHGGINFLNRFLHYVPESNNVIITYHVMLSLFRYMANQGQFEVLNRLIALAPDDVLSRIRANVYRSFAEVASNGHLEVLNRLIELAPDDTLSMIRTDEYHAFRNAAANGRLEILNRLIELAPDDVLSMVRAANYRAFGNAATNAHLHVLNRLIELAPNDVLPMVRAEDYEAFRYAAANGYIDIVNQLLTYPSVLAYAEMHVREYGDGVQPFIRTTLDRLRTEKATFEQANPRGVFNLDSPERAQSCFYMLRHLIRCNDARYSDDIRFLLSIPAVRALAPATVTPNEANELLRLALTLGNQAAAEILLTIPAVRELAEHNNYYRHEQQGGIDLRALAQDRESSMRALSVREQRQIQAAITRYQPMIRAGGVVHIMSDLRERLAERYTATPARLTRDDGSTLLLPMTWEAFRALELSPSEHERALQAYYQHPDHNAWRYLLKPNPWMHARASYVNVNPLHLQERWSTFDEYEDLISLLYLAAIDTQTPAEDGYTIDTRFTHFIQELALIGRAHNWDTTRPRTNAQGHIVSEEYDDLQGDKPSCYSGVKRRLFQAVQGHPLFKPLTLNVIKAELREFMRQHFVNAINEDNQDALKEAWLALCEGEADDGSFDALNVSEAQQRDFFEYLTRKYATEFTDNGALTAYLRKAFKLSDTDDLSHVARFAGETDFASLLPTTSSPGLK